MFFFSPSLFIETTSRSLSVLIANGQFLLFIYRYTTILCMIYPLLQEDTWTPSGLGPSGKPDDAIERQHEEIVIS